MIDYPVKSAFCFPNAYPEFHSRIGNMQSRPLTPVFTAAVEVFDHGNIGQQHGCHPISGATESFTAIRNSCAVVHDDFASLKESVHTFDEARERSKYLIRSVVTWLQGDIQLLDPPDFKRICAAGSRRKAMRVPV